MWNGIEATKVFQNQQLGKAARPQPSSSKRNWRFFLLALLCVGAVCALIVLGMLAITPIPA